MAFQTFDLGQVLQTAEAIKAQRRQPAEDALRQRYLTAQTEGAEQNIAIQKQQAASQMEATTAHRAYYTSRAILSAADPKAAAESLAPDFVKQFDATHGQGAWKSLTPEQTVQAAKAIQTQALGIIGPQQKVKWIDSGGQQIAVDEQTGEPVKNVAPIAKTATPDAALSAQTSTANAELSANTTVRGQDISASTTRRGQDLTDARARDTNAVSQGQNVQVVAGKIRDDYNQTVKNTGWYDQQGFYQRLKTVGNDKTGASDLALVFSYMKVLDPTSAVREGEYATARDTAGIPSKIVAQYNKVLSGAFLAPEQRAEFLNTADKIYQAGYKRQEAIQNDYSAKAQRAGLDPRDVITDLGAPAPTGTAPVQIKGDADYAKLPSGATYVGPDGKTRTKR